MPRTSQKKATNASRSRSVAASKSTKSCATRNCK